MKKLFALILFITGVVTVHAQQPVNGLELPYGIKVLDTLATDAWYGPYESQEDAVASVPHQVRKNRTVKIGALEYWWRSDTTANGLVLKFNQPGTLTGQSFLTNYGAVAYLNIRRGGGTESSPTALLRGQSTQVRFGGYTGSAFTYGVMINTFANEDWTPTKNGMDLSISVKEEGTTTDVSNFHILGTSTNAGSVVFGEYTAATARVQIRRNQNYPNVDLFNVTTQDNERLYAIDKDGNVIMKNPTRTTGTSIRFDFQRTYGYTTPEGGNITLDDTNFKEGVTQLLIHNSSSEPTFGDEFKIIGGEYKTNQDNYIFMQSVKPTNILTTITQIGGSSGGGVSIEEVMDSIYNAIDTLSSGGSTNSTALRGKSLDESVGSPEDGDILIFRDAGDDWVLEKVLTITEVMDSIMNAIDSLASLTRVMDSIESALTPIASTGTAIKFDRLRTYGYSSPETGNITLDDTDYKEGITQLVVHNDGTEPTFGEEFIKIGGTYQESQDNYIYLQSFKDDLVLVTISQEGGGISSGVTVGQMMDSLQNGIDTVGVWGNITGTLADQTDLKNALDAKTTTALTASTGTAIAFDIPRRYGTHASPIIGNITYNSTGAVVGQVQAMIHNDSSEPTWPLEFDIISGAYIPNTDNKILMFLVESGHVWVTISQTVE